MKMEQSSSKEAVQLRSKIVKLYDELTEFSCQCAFLCDSFSSIVAQTEFIEANTIEGLDYYARWLKGRTLEIKEDLRIIHEQAKIVG